MNIGTKQYAKALYELTKNKNENEIDSIILNFANDLKKQKKLKLADDIMNKFSDIYNIENEIIEVEVISARDIIESQVEKIKKFVKDKYRVKEVIIDKKVDKEIKGGIILRVGDEIIDGSVSKKLKKLSVLLKK